MTTKAKISSWGFFKTEKVLQNEKATCETGENTCKPSMIDKGLISKYEEFIQLNSKKPNNPIEKKRVEDSNRHLSKEHIQKGNRYMKRCFTTSLIIREMKIKTPMRHHFTPVRMDTPIKTKDNRY